MEEQSEELASAEQLLQPRPLSANKFASFFQRIWRWWQGVWCAFSQKHPKLSAWAYKIAFFLVFSIGEDKRLLRPEQKALRRKGRGRERRRRKENPPLR